MKINNFPLEPTPLITSYQQGKAGDAAAAGKTESLQTAVQLMFDNQVRTVLSQLTRMLTQQNSALLSLPAALSTEAEQLLKQPLTGEQVVPKGLAAMLQGQKTVSQSISSLLNALSDAETVKETFPDGLPEALAGLLAKLDDQLTHLDPDIQKTLLALAQELTDSSEPVTDTSAALLQAGQKLISTLPKEEYAIPRKEFEIKLPVLLKNLTDNFRQELAKLPLPPLEQEALADNLRQISQQLFLELTQPSARIPLGQTSLFAESSPEAAENKPLAFVALPAVIDDIIDYFEGQLIKTDVAFEKDVLIANLRQIFRQMTQDLRDEDLDVMSRLIDQIKDSVPEKLQLAATTHNIPEIKDIWVMQRLAASRQWLGLTEENLKQSVQILRDMSTAVPRQAETLPDSAPGRASFSLALPLYFGEEKKAYPTYIHIYQDREKSRGLSAFPTETWLRVCLATENVGIVDMVFHVYSQNRLNIRVQFSDQVTADQFKAQMDEIRSKFDYSPLTLADFTVNPAQTGGLP